MLLEKVPALLLAVLERHRLAALLELAAPEIARVRVARGERGVVELGERPVLDGGVDGAPDAA